MAGGDTAATMKAFTDTVSEISECSMDVIDEETKNKRNSKLFTSIKSTISDQGPIIACFNA